MSNPRVAICFSGGADSAVLLSYYLKQAARKPEELVTLTFDYGQRNAREIDFAKDISKRVRVQHVIVRLPLEEHLIGNSLTDKSVDTAEPGRTAGRVPFRNTIFVAYAAAYIACRGGDTVALGIMQPTNVNQYDSSSIFAHRLEQLLQVADDNPDFILDTPFLHWDKVDVFDLGIRNKVDFSNTWTCWHDGETSCGKCIACVERIKAFQKLGYIDPLLYQEKNKPNWTGYNPL